MSAAESNQTPEPAAVTPKRRRWRLQLASRGAMKRLAVLFAIIGVALVYCYFTMLSMPGDSYRGPLPQLTPSQRELADELHASVAVLVGETPSGRRTGNRSVFYPRQFAEAAAWLKQQLHSYGYAEVNEIFVERGSPAPNLEVILSGTSRPNEIIVVGAHYDAFQGTPGADDNASGVAACLYLARTMQSSPRARTIRFLFFVNEEPPTFWTPDMGSWVYAKKCKAAGDDIVGMLSLETIGYYRDEPGSQKYPWPLNLVYPDRGDFIGFVSDYSSRHLNKRAIASFRTHAKFPSEGGSPPGVMPGVGWSDHWSFSKEGYPAIMITDTAPFRNPHYHTATDDVDTLDYERMARAVEGIEAVVNDLADTP
jgi:Zn-dependent M28 family amino/carboxypeptidase